MKTSPAVKAKISKSLKLYWKKRKTTTKAPKKAIAKKGIVLSKKKTSRNFGVSAH